MSYERTVEPAEEPLGTAALKTHLRVDSSDEDDYIGELITGARELVEDDARRTLVTSTWKRYLDAFPGARGTEKNHVICLERPRILTVESVEYVDTEGATQTLDSSLYQLDAKSEPGRLLPAFNQVWPATRDVLNAVIVTFTAGYGAASAVPQKAKQAIRLLVGHWFRHRETVGMVPDEIRHAYDELVSRLQWGGYA